MNRAIQPIPKWQRKFIQWQRNTKGDTLPLFGTKPTERLPAKNYDKTNNGDVSYVKIIQTTAPITM